jgi:hypothetical protein
MSKKESEDRKRMPQAGWSSKELPVLSDDQLGKNWTIAEAAGMLGPPELTELQLRQLVSMLGLQPVGRRPGSTRYVRAYKADDLIRLYEALATVTHPME